MRANAIESSDQLVLHATNAMGLVALCVVRHGRLELPTPALRACLAWPPGVTSMVLGDVVAQADLARVERSLTDASSSPTLAVCRAVRADGGEFDAELLLTRIDAAALPDAVAVTWTDVSARRTADEHLRHMAFSDPLTGLANRALLGDRLRQALLHARRSGVGFSVLAADLDGFKAVNDRLGHDNGDAVLREVARRLRGCVRESDTLARVGGDEFTFVLPAAKDAASAAIVAGRSIRAIGKPFEVDGQTVHLGLTIGIATFPLHASEADALLASADASLYDGKRAGKNRYRVAAVSTVPPRPTAGVWSAALEVGVASIDAQHQKLAAHIDQLADDLQQGRDRAHLLATLEALVAQTVSHFADEERLMVAAQYAGHEVHAREHRRLLEDVTNLSVAIDDQSMALTKRYLHDWLVRHIETMDRATAHALIRAGVG